MTTTTNRRDLAAIAAHAAVDNAIRARDAIIRTSYPIAETIYVTHARGEFFAIVIDYAFREARLKVRNCATGRDSWRHLLDIRIA